MPVTKIANASGSAYAGKAIRQLSTGRLIFVFHNSRKVHIYDSDDNGATRTRRTAMAGIAAGGNINTVWVSEVMSDNTIWIYLRGTFSPYRNYYAIVGLDNDGNTTITEVRHTNRFGNSGTNIWVHLYPGPAPLTSGQGWVSQQRFSARAFNKRTIPASGGSIGFQGQTRRLMDGHIDWTHSGDGRTNSAATFALFGRFVAGNNGSPTGDLSALLDITNQQRFTVTDGMDEVVACDGTNVWCRDDAHGAQSHSRLIRIPYARLSQQAVSVRAAGEWQCFAHYQGTLMAIHSAGGKAYELDTATATFEASTEAHTDFASTSTDFDCVRYPTSGVMFVLSSAGDFYRVVFNTAPGRPILTTPMVRDVAASLTLDWSFSDPDNDTQASYELRRRIEGSTDYEYWNGAAWVAATGASTIIAHTTQQATLTAAQWKKAGTTEDHWFSIRVRDHPAGAVSEWSADARVCLVTVAAPVITAIGRDDSSPFSDVFPLAAKVTWTAAQQEQFRVQVYEDNAGAAGDQRSDSGWLTSEDRFYEVAFGADAETGHLRVTVKGFGSADHATTVAYTVDLPDPPGATTITAAAHGTNLDHIRVTGTWPSVPAVSTATLHRRETGSTGNGVVVAEELAVENNSVTFDDWRVASGVGYEYRWHAVTTDGGEWLDAAWTA